MWGGRVVGKALLNTNRHQHPYLFLTGWPDTTQPGRRKAKLQPLSRQMPWLGQAWNDGCDVTIYTNQIIHHSIHYVRVLILFCGSLFQEAAMKTDCFHRYSALCPNEYGYGVNKCNYGRHRQTLHNYMPHATCHQSVCQRCGFRCLRPCETLKPSIMERALMDNKSWGCWDISAYDGSFIIMFFFGWDFLYSNLSLQSPIHLHCSCLQPSSLWMPLKEFKIMISLGVY